MDSTDHAAHERRLAAALRELVQQIDISDYRDRLGQPAENNLAFVKAQAVCDAFCVSHEDVCAALDRTDDEDLAEAGKLIPSSGRWLTALLHI